MHIPHGYRVHEMIYDSLNSISCSHDVYGYANVSAMALNVAYSLDMQHETWDSMLHIQ